MSPRRRAALAIGLSTVMVLVIAALLPRVFLANDDIGFTEYLRKNTFTPWISPILSQGFGFAYQQAPGVPWYGLYQYIVIIATGAVLIHTCTELVDRRPGIGRTVTWVGAAVIAASHTILVSGITWTTVSISALGTAVAAFVAHALVCQAEGTRMSRLRALLYGLLFVSGYMLRLQGLGATAVALAPLLGWVTWRFVKLRHLPRLAAVGAMLAPFIVVVAVQNRMPQAQAQGRADDWFNNFNNERGRIHGHAAFEGLDRRAPELVTRAGWTLDEYRDFTNWLILDEDDYPIEKVERLIATGGVPEVVTVDWSIHQLRGIFDDSAASITLFLCIVAAGAMLALLGLIDRWRGLGYCIGYVAYLIAVPVWMSAHYRFPQRVSLSIYSVAALGVFLFIARSVADRPAQPTISERPRIVAGLATVAFLLSGWAWHLAGWLHRDPPPHRDELQALEDRVTARGGFVFVYVQAGLVELDPLRAEPRGYDGLQGGWGTFSPSWYATVKRLGVHRGGGVLHAMLDNPDAYLLAPRGARATLQDWVQRKLKTPDVRLAIVDGAAVYDDSRPELYRLVTAPLVHDSDEWRQMARDESALSEALPGPPSVTDLTFHPVASPRASQVRHAMSAAEVEPIDGGVRCTLPGARDGCATTNDGGEIGTFAGVDIPVHGLRAARFELHLIDPENIIGVQVLAETATSRSIRWRWHLDPDARRFGFTGPITLVPGSPAHRLELAVDTARPEDVRDLHVFVEVTPGTHAGFELRALEISER